MWCLLAAVQKMLCQILPQETDINTSSKQIKSLRKYYYVFAVKYILSYLTLKYFQWVADYLQVKYEQPQSLDLSWEHLGAVKMFIDDLIMVQIYIARINTVWLFYWWFES